MVMVPKQISERLRTDIARLSVEGNQLRLDGAQKLSSTTFNLTPNNIPFPVPGDPFFTVSYDLGFTTCYDIGEYQSIGVSRRPGDDSGPIVATWGDNSRIWKSPSDSTAPGIHAQADVFSSRLEPPLYPAELRAHLSFLVANRTRRQPAPRNVRYSREEAAQRLKIRRS